MHLVPIASNGGRAKRAVGKLLSVATILALVLTLLPVVPAMAAAGNSTAKLTNPPEGGIVAEVTAFQGEATDPDGVTGVSIAVQNASGQYVQHLVNGGWASTFKAFSAQVTVGGTVYQWTVSGVNSLIFGEGNYTATIVVNDGTNIDYHYATFAVDKTGPQLSGPVPEPGSFIAGRSQELFAVTATDDPAGVSTVELVYRVGATGQAVTVPLLTVTGSVYSTTLDLSNTATGDIVYFKFTATDAAGNRSETPEYTVTVDKKPPAEVTNLTVTAPPEGGKLVLSWADPTDADYVQANVYYRTLPDGTWNNAGSAPKGQQTFTISGLDPSGATKYAVKVTTVDGFGNESSGVAADNNGQGYAAKDVKPPAEVSSLKVTVVPAGGALNLEWTNPADADYQGAKVYFRKLADTSWTYSGTVTGAVYQYQVMNLVNGVPYAVKVTAFDVYANESAGVVDDNNGQGYVPTDTQAPGEVTGAQAWAPAEGGSIIVSWIDPADIDLNHVNVYMRVKGSTDWGTPVAVEKGVGYCEFGNLDRTGETRYEFKVSVVDALRNESQGVELNNNGQGYTAKDQVPPSDVAQPTVSIPAQGGSLEVRWTDPGDADLHHVNVYCRPIGTTGDTWGLPQQVSAGVQQCVVTGLANGHAYEVKLTAVDDIGNESTGLVLNNNGQGYLPKQLPVDTTPPGEVQGLAVTPVAGPGAFAVSFTCPADSDLARVRISMYGTSSYEHYGTVELEAQANQVFEGLPVMVAPDVTLGGEQRVMFKVVTVDQTGNASAGLQEDDSGQGYAVVAHWQLLPGPEGWTTFSVPVQLAGGQKLLGDLIDVGAVDVAYKYDSATQQWVQVTEDNNTIAPLEALYVKLKREVLATIRPTTTPGAPPVRKLYKGWNLVGPTDNRAVHDTLVSVAEGWRQVVSVPGNPEVWAATPYTEYYTEYYQLRWVHTHYGYWIYMASEGDLAGFVGTPVTVGNYPVGW
ncbi:MAG: fibronectin type III domain-containing protein [Bacillota bacterium]